MEDELVPKKEKLFKAYRRLQAEVIKRKLEVDLSTNHSMPACESVLEYVPTETHLGGITC